LYKEESNLGKACYRFKKKYKQNKLTNEEIKLLEQIPNWTWELRHQMTQFNESISKLEKWVIKNNKLPSRNSNDKQEKCLAMWYFRQFQNIKLKLNEEETKKLKGIKYLAKNPK
jgi:hypothetical protein